MWQYDSAFIWIDGTLMTGGFHHADMIDSYIRDQTALDDEYNKIFDELMTKPVLPGHVGRWVIQDAFGNTDNHPSASKYKRNDKVAVFFTHQLAENVAMGNMAQYKNQVLSQLNEVPVFRGIREAKPKEHFTNNQDPPESTYDKRWYTEIDPGEMHLANRYNVQRADRYFQDRYPNEIHNVGGDCINPKCDYVFTDADENTMKLAGGWITCPKCQYTYNYLDDAYNYGMSFNRPGGATRAGITMDEMGTIGEDIVMQMGEIPGVGKVIESHAFKGFPIDFTIGPYGVEVKTNHSEAQARFKLGGAYERTQKIRYCNENNLKPGFIGVRLNFYNNTADVFFRDAFTDTWIGNPKLRHVGKVDFSNLNPFKRPEDVPPANMLPDDDSDIPF